MAEPGAGDQRADRIVLVGMMGAGKTAVGRRLAARLADLDGGAADPWTHVDTDALVEAATGRSVTELFATAGEVGFRKEEHRALVTALASGGAAVVSTGGGVVLSEANRALLRRAGVVVWLRARTQTLAGRVGTGGSRPLLGADPTQALAQLMAERAVLYDDVAQVVVDVDGRSVAEVTDVVLAAVEARTGVGSER